MDRFAEYRATAKALGTDAIALVPGANFVRLMGQDFSTSERPTLIVVPASGAPAAIMPNLELDSFAALDFPGAVFDWRDQDGYDAAFAALAAHLPLTSLAVEGQAMRVFVHHALAKAYPGLRIVDGERPISGLRLAKTDADIAALTRAIQISEAALGEVLDTVRVGMTEREIEARLIAAQFAHGAQGMAFSPIVAASTNSALAHAHARDYALEAGDTLLIDFGARWGGFCADITRTVFVGHATDHQAAVYQTVYDALQAGLAVTRAGVTAHEIDDAVQSVLESSPWPDRMLTKTGHGLGRQVHEEPYVMRGNHQILPAGTVYTNEPGLYDTAEFGVRIEDDVLVTKDGYRLLTTFPKTLTVVG